MLERGDRRICAARQMSADEQWCLVSFSIPESQRDLRHQLRRRLLSIGWDLDALMAEHERFLAGAERIAATEPEGDRQAFAAYVQLIDSWRILPYVDPGLPTHLLPDDWPGQRSVDTFLALSARLHEPAWRHVRAVVASAS